MDELEGSSPISSSADKFYSFFKNDMNELVNIAPATFQSVDLISGEDGSVGAVKRWKYVLDDGARSITFRAVEGDVLQLYKTFQFTLAVSDGLAQWTILYERALPTAPPPDAYITFANVNSKLVDLYLLTH
ncbi:UNVERIFIED_CONTAM: MLP-like protein 43 [Sesamum angustifolium]|uniref:MLP-like protein 43 n=1 Tax=Sesamum angustifolium TaxID=2727405 RepID=A0AAW2IP30_9LAMI